MSLQSHRSTLWNNLDQQWDLIIIGGGITGGGIFNLASRHGIKTLLVEALDFAGGTSSKSSKLVHGGLRYLQNKQFGIVKESVRERERLIKENPDLIQKLGFLFSSYENLGTSYQMLSIGTAIYDLLVPKWEHQIIPKHRVKEWEPLVRMHELTGAVQYFDASVDDSRLVFRVIQDGIIHGGVALNYSKVISLLKNNQGQINGVVLQNQDPELKQGQVELSAKVVINATGPWTDEIRSFVNSTPRLRKQRGSHLIFSREKLPVKQAVTMIHPKDHRALFVIPWEGVTFIGTTDLDQSELTDETTITSQEVEYLLQACDHIFPEQEVTHDDIISTFSGLRPIINSGAKTPGKESRKHEIWDEDGLITITGGKLTIFRVMAADVLNRISPLLGINPQFSYKEQIFETIPIGDKPAHIPLNIWQKFTSKYGTHAYKIAEFFDQNSDQTSPNSKFEICEIKWSLNNEAIVHLDDLLLRRFRIGLCNAEGGIQEILLLRPIIQSELNWDDSRWESELNRYKKLWRKFYYLP